MKKIIALILALVLCLSLCACKSKEAEAVDELILAIGTVNQESLDSIAAARTAYDALPEGDRSDVENYNTLVDAEAEYALQAFNAVNSAFESNDMQLADQYYQSFLADDRIKFTDEQRTTMEENRELIKTMCFMGTYMVMPEYIVDQKIERIDASSSKMKYYLTKEALSVSYDFSSKGSLALAFDQYLDYLNQVYYQYDYRFDGGYEIYSFTNEQGGEFEITTSPDYGFLMIYIYRDFFDASKMDTSDPKMTIRGVAKDVDYVD